MSFNQGLLIDDTLHSAALNVELLGEQLRYSLRMKSADRVGISKITKLDFPVSIGETALSDGLDIHCLGPDEWLIVTNPDKSEKLSKALAKAESKYVMSVTEISHRNVCFVLTGENVLDVLLSGCPIDLSLDAFPIGRSTRTVFESATILLTRRAEDTFTIECWRSFAPYLRDFFARVARTGVGGT